MGGKGERRFGLDRKKPSRRRPYANACQNADGDSCDDCSITGADGTGPSPGNDGDDNDGDLLLDLDETSRGTDPLDADSDDDGLTDGAEPRWFEDTDQDGAINALDPDSDGDAILDGTESGVVQPSPDTDASAGNFAADEDPGTTTSPIDPDTDGGIDDGVEDADRNGRVDAGEFDPNDPADDGAFDSAAARPTAASTSPSSPTTRA